MTGPHPLSQFARSRSLSAGGLLAAALLSGCVQASDTRQPRGAAQIGSYQAVAEGRAFTGSVRPGAAGTVLSAAGARAVAGMEVQVLSQDGAGLGRDQGLGAKSGAEALCKAAGGRFNPEVLGRYLAPNAWVFAGGCQ